MIIYRCRVLLASLLWLLASGFSQRVPIHFSYITTKSGGFITSGAIPAVDLALKLINNRTDILTNYNLSYNNIHDSKVRSNYKINQYDKIKSYV